MILGYLEGLSQGFLVSADLLSLLRGLSAGPTAFTSYELIRVPAKIWPALQHRLGTQKNFVVAWLQAVCDSCPERTVLQLVRGNPELFPSFLAKKRASLLLPNFLELRNNDDISIRDGWPQARIMRAEDEARAASRVMELSAFRACRFQQGFASEGMLCNEPPIPLQVLDFLEAQDLVNISLVCKSMHQAAHLLFIREEGVATQHYPPDLMLDPNRQVNILSIVRLGSLMQGAPEDIHFVRRGSFQFLRSNVNPDRERVTWAFDNSARPRDAVTYATELLQVDYGECIPVADAFGQLHVYVIEALCLEDLQVQLANLPFPKVPGPVSDTLEEIKLLVAAARRKEEHLLLHVDEVILLPLGSF